ncbi:MAG: D-alanine--D-alanine ligase, partial [Acidimicrobiales bacterium]
MFEPRRRLVVLFGGRSAEHDVSCTSARHVLEAIDREKYAVEAVGITRDGAWVRADDPLAAIEAGAEAVPEMLTAAGPGVDPMSVLAGHLDEAPVVFPVLHGPQGEDGTMQGLLDLLDVPYVGTGVLGSALCMDKIKAKEMLDSHSIPQGRWHGLHADDRSEALVDQLIAELGVPLFVKPANMGSSVGVSKAEDAQDLTRALALAASYDQWIVVEQTVVGREIECSVLGNRDPVVSVA